MREPLNGYCPHLGENKTIFVRYSITVLGGGQPPNRKDLGFDCDEIESCEREYKKPCPIMKQYDENKRQRRQTRP